jgi:hypothetical protein
VDAYLFRLWQNLLMHLPAVKKNLLYEVYDSEWKRACGVRIGS